MYGLKPSVATCWFIHVSCLYSAELWHLSLGYIAASQCRQYITSCLSGLGNINNLAELRLAGHQNIFGIINQDPRYILSEVLSLGMDTDRCTMVV